jgi:hypothetical protein
MDACSIAAGACSLDGLVQQSGHIQQLLISVQDGMDDLARKLERLEDKVEKLRIEWHVAS